MNPEEMDAAIARFNAGEPLPSVDPRAMQGMWEVTQTPEAKARPNMAFGLGAFAGSGLDPQSLNGEGFVAISLRQMLLMSLVKRGVLRDYSDGEKLRPEVFRAVAIMPCDRGDVSEALALQHLPEMSAEEVAKLREQMQAESYDLERPTVDAKFLAWMRDSTSDRYSRPVTMYCSIFPSGIQKVLMLSTLLPALAR